jgi:hypothetical protein
MGGWFDFDRDAGFHGFQGGAHGVDCPQPSIPPLSSITPTQFLTFFANDTNMSAQDPALIQMKIDISAPNFNVDRWGGKYNLGQYYYVAHMIIMDKIASLNPIVDVVTTKRAGSVSKGSASDLIQAQNQNPFLRTIYGQEYLRLLRSLAGGPAAL